MAKLLMTAEAQSIRLGADVANAVSRCSEQVVRAGADRSMLPIEVKQTLEGRDTKMQSHSEEQVKVQTSHLSYDQVARMGLFRRLPFDGITRTFLRPKFAALSL